MRRLCSALVGDLDLPAPAGPDELIGRLCERMGHRLGRPVHHRVARFDSDEVSGLWMATDTDYWVVCEERTSGWHRLAIAAHEFWHMEADHSTPAPVGGDHRFALPSLDDSTVARIVATRAHCTDGEEREAETFASLLLSRVSRWLPPQPPPVAPHRSAVPGVPHRSAVPGVVDHTLGRRVRDG